MELIVSHGSLSPEKDTFHSGSRTSCQEGVYDAGDTEVENDNSLN